MAPGDGGEQFNRLIHETSPYLLQHAHNPVEWYPWSDDAFDRAKQLDRPIFLSVGYSTCHWCHVMAHESFEDPEVARYLNAHFVAIKVDREQRPDVDQIYMNATQLLTGRGGWPNSVWLTPDGRPFFAGTYYPKQGFLTILRRVDELWRDRRQDVENQADALAQAIQQMAGGGPGPTGEPTDPLDRNVVAALIEELGRSADDSHGGFGGAPKFPPHGALRVLLYEHRRTGREDLLALARRTLDAMARGGIRDHLGGGFHRYATDARWFLPHFEKMLYDNAQLARAYVEAYLATRDDDYRRVAEGIYDCVLREMTDTGGGFHSAYDADSEGVEGKFYLWTRREILDLLGNDAGLFCRAYGVSDQGNYYDEASQQRTGTNILYLPRPTDQVAAAEGMTAETLRGRLADARRKLLAHRAKRVWPHLDDKVLAGWNGLMIGSLAYGGRHLDRPRYTAAAERAAEFVLATLRRDGRLLRSYRDGQARLNAYLDDYAFLADGLLELHLANDRRNWIAEAEALMQVLVQHYHDDQAGGFFFTSRDHEDLLARVKSPFDSAIPSGNGAAAGVLLRLAEHTGNRQYAEWARDTLQAFWPMIRRSPRGTESLILATAMYFDRQAEPAESRPAPPPAEETPDASAQAGPVTAEAFVSQSTLAPGQTFDLAVRLTIQEGFHINSARPLQDYLIATAVAAAADGVAQLGDVRYPADKEIALGFSDEKLSVYDGRVWLRAPVTIAPAAATGRHDLKLAVRHQACDDQRCLPPATLTLTIPLQIQPTAGQDTPRHAGIFQETPAGK